MRDSAVAWNKARPRSTFAEVRTSRGSDTLDSANRPGAHAARLLDGDDRVLVDHRYVEHFGLAAGAPTAVAVGDLGRLAAEHEHLRREDATGVRLREREALASGALLIERHHVASEH